MLDTIATLTIMLADDSIRPKQRLKLKEELDMYRGEVKALYLDMYKIISN